MNTCTAPYAWLHKGRFLSGGKRGPRPIKLLLKFYPDSVQLAALSPIL